MVAHYHGQVWSGAELARSFGIAHATVRRYVDVLTAALVLRQLDLLVVRRQRRYGFEFKYTAWSRSDRLTGVGRCSPLA